MEPIEASNLDNQYKYYWEGDLCGQVEEEDGAALACPACGCEELTHWKRL